MLFYALAFVVLSSPAADNYFKITVVNQQTGRGVPLVELETTNHVRYWTDSHGVVAFYEPGLMNQRVYFSIKSHGYEFAKDGFGTRGQALEIKPGGSARLKIKRINVAERLYRVTGGGIYRDSVLLGLPVSLRRPLLNGQVFGSDSVINVVYQGKIYWLWGDTTRPSYPLGNFHGTGASSDLPGKGGLDPELGVDLHYFVDKSGFAKQMAPLSGIGTTWLSCPLVVRTADGKERLFAYYMKVAPGTLKKHEHGLLEFNDQEQQFNKVVQLDLASPLDFRSMGHPFQHRVDGKDFIYLATPYPLIRVPAVAEAVIDPRQYEMFTPLHAGSSLKSPQLDRTADGTLRYGWRTNTPALSPEEQDRLVGRGLMKPKEAILALRDIDTGTSIRAHAGSVYWNAYRGRWVMITNQAWGTSMLGEVWFAEADTPLGPWVYARKIVTHDKYSFYNPKHHPMFDKEQGRILFFEGTYSNTFSGNVEQTPWYDYNQIMYKLDLADPRLILPVAVYRSTTPGMLFSTIRHSGTAPQTRQPAFFAPDRLKAGAVPVIIQQIDKGEQRLAVRQLQTDEKAQILFYALPAEPIPKQAETVPLYEFIHANGKDRVYSTDVNAGAPGYRRLERPLCHVWRSPVRFPESP